METWLDHRRSACSNFINKVRSRPGSCVGPGRAYHLQQLASPLRQSMTVALIIWIRGFQVWRADFGKNRCRFKGAYAPLVKTQGQDDDCKLRDRPQWSKLCSKVKQRSDSAEMPEELDSLSNRSWERPRSKSVIHARHFGQTYPDSTMGSHPWASDTLT